MNKEAMSTKRVCAVVLRSALRAVVCCVFFVEMGCSPFRQSTFYQVTDLNPPVFESASAVAAQHIELCFDESIRVVENSAKIDNGLTVEAITDIQCGVAFTVDTPLQPGRAYRVGITVEDANQNSLNVVTELYGYNPAVPTIRINEFTTRGSSNHPDMVELYLLEGGNIGGVTLYNGTASEWKSRKILPDITLPAGSYLLIHFKPEGIAAEKDEVADSDSSGGKDTHPAAWDFWVEGGSGLSGNNGVLTLYQNPYGTLVDAALYSNRTSASDTSYRGFGSTTFMRQADEIVAAGGWITEHPLVRPEDCIYSDHSTATRSLNRSSTSADTDSAADWHTVPTSGYTFGEVNSEQRHTP